MKDRVLALKTENIRSLFFRLAIPAVIAQLATLAYNIADRIYIGHIPGIGAMALTGVGVCMPVTLIIAAFTQLIGGGGGPRMSYYMGKGQQDTAKKVLGNGVIFAVVTGIALTVIFRIFSEQILVAFGAGENTLPFALDYLNIYIFGTLFTEIASGLVFYITAQGKTLISMLSVFIGTGLNIALDPLFIYTFDMGIKGAAVATVISQGASAAFVLLYLRRKNTPVNIQRPFLKIDKALLKESLALGVSPFIMVLTESLVSVSFNQNLRIYGGDMAVGAYSIFAVVMQMATLPMTGFAQGAQPITSYNYGAGDYKRVAKNLRLLFLTSTVFSTAMWAFILIFPGVFAAMFSSDASIIGAALSNMRIFFAMLWIMGPQFAGQYSYVALGNAKTSLFLALLRKVILLAPLIYIVPLIAGQNAFGVFLAEPIADTIAALSTVISFFVKYRGLFKNTGETDTQKSIV